MPKRRVFRAAPLFRRQKRRERTPDSDEDRDVDNKTNLRSDKSISASSDMCTTSEFESTPKQFQLENPTMRISSEYTSTQSETVTDISKQTNFSNSSTELVKEKPKVSYRARAEVIQQENAAY